MLCGQEMQPKTKPVGGKQSLQNNRRRRATPHQRGEQERSLAEPLLSEHGSISRSDSSVSRPVSPPRQLASDGTTECWYPEDDTRWTQPPPPAEGHMIVVDMSVNIDMLHSVSTVDNCAYVEFSVLLHWTDQRLRGWEAPDHLPGNLWGPDLELAGTLGEVTEVGCEFCLRDSETGRLKRNRRFKGMVAKYWNNLKQDFPFDLDMITVCLYTNSHYVTYDELKEGVVSKGRTYILRQVQDPLEGNWLNLWWNGEVAEWKILGISTMLDEEEEQPDGTATTNFYINFHVREQPRSVLALSAPASCLILQKLTTKNMANRFRESMGITF